MTGIEFISESAENTGQVNAEELTGRRMELQARMEEAQAAGNPELARFYSGEISDLDEKIDKNVRQKEKEVSDQRDEPYEESADAGSGREKGRLSEKRERADQEQMIGSPDSARPYLDKAEACMEKSRRYEGQANDLERKIQRGREPGDRQSDVRNLRKKAADEKKEADRYKRKAVNELRR